MLQKKVMSKSSDIGGDGRGYPPSLSFRSKSAAEHDTSGGKS
jgi:hypothetical protein